MAQKNPGGRPHFAPSVAQRKLVESLAAYGLPQADICRLVEQPNGRAISEHTLRKHFRAELDTGAAKANAKVAESLFRQATGEGRGAVTAAIFWLKTRAGWKETTVIETTGDAAARDELVERIESRLARLAAVDQPTEDPEEPDE